MSRNRKTEHGSGTRVEDTKKARRCKSTGLLPKIGCIGLYRLFELERHRE